MFSSKNSQMNERKNRSKVTRYAIKKLSMGTASVAVALGFLFVQGQSVVLADTVSLIFDLISFFNRLEI